MPYWLILILNLLTIAFSLGAVFFAYRTQNLQSQTIKSLQRELTDMSATRTRNAEALPETETQTLRRPEE